MSKNLYNNDTYLNRDISCLINNEIYEYDISRAGYSISIFYNLLPPDIRDKASAISDKEKLSKFLGVYQRDNKEYNLALRQAFKDIRKLFFETNDLKEDDILSVKKDAIFTLRPCANTEFDNVKFKMKNLYTSYYLFDRYEFYHNSMRLDVKNLGEYAIDRHKKYMLDFLFKLFTLMETASKKKRVIKPFVEFRNYYVAGRLDPEYYRELNNKALFAAVVNDELIYTTESPSIDYIVKNYNFDTYIKPIANILY